MPGLALAGAVVVLGPMLRPGFPLRFDLVSVPRPVLGADALGLGDRLPRAVPLDAATAVLATVLPDDWLTQLLALAALVLAGWGAARLVGGPLPARLAAVVAAQWNPFVLEQLAIGHVPHLLAYGAAPWVGRAAWELVTGARPGPAAWAVVVLAAGLGSLTPGGGVLVVLAGVAGALAGAAVLQRGDRPRRGGGGGGRLGGQRGARRVLVAVVPFAVLQLPWLVAGIASPGIRPAPGQDAGVTAFALRGETHWGRLVDAAGLAGMWNSTALPPSRETVLARVSTVLILVLAALGALGLRRFLPARPDLRPAVAWAGAAAAVGYLVAVLPVLPGGTALLEALVRDVPGAGLLRDGHRWLALPALGFAVLAGHAVALVEHGLGSGADRDERAGPAGRAGRIWGSAVLVSLLLVAAVPDLALGLGGRLQSWTYPAQWAQVRATLDAAPDSARVLVLPWQPFRDFPWSGGGVVLDPAPRLLPRQTMVSDALTVSDRPLPSEGPGASAVSAELARTGRLEPAFLRSWAVGWILVEHRTAGSLPVLPAGWSTVVDGPDLTLLRAPDPLPAAPSASTARTVAVVGAHLAGAAVLVGALAALLTGRRRRVLRPGRDDAASRS